MTAGLQPRRQSNGDGSAYSSSSSSLSQQQRFQTNQALVLTLLTVMLLGSLSIVYNNDSAGDVISNFDSTSRHLLSTRWLEQSQDDDVNNGGGGNNNNNDDDNDGDYSRFSCRYIYEEVPESGPTQCQFAKTCNGGDGVWGSWVFCLAANDNNSLNVYMIFGLLSPILILWMVTLFRLLGSTAEDFFSPSLEMFSIKLGLPPRFAGVTLLALGNGAADVSATMSAIANDEENGYKLSLGALTGAAMLVGGVVSGIVILVADGVRCRGALVRDVMALAVTIAIVWSHLSSGIVSSVTTTLFLSLYGFFVLTVLVADVYHRAVVLPRLTAAALAAAEAEANGLPPPVNVAEQVNPFMQFITAFSNYDNPCRTDTTIPADETVTGEGFSNAELAPASVPSNGITTSTQPVDTSLGISPPQRGVVGSVAVEEHFILHGQHGILHGNGRVPASAADSEFATRSQLSASSSGSVGGVDGIEIGGSSMQPNPTDVGQFPASRSTWSGLMETGTGGGVYSLVEDHMDNLCVGNSASSTLVGPDGIPASSIGIPSSNWRGAWHDGKQEVKESLTKLWDDIAYDGDLKMHDRVLMLCELPFTVLRKASIPIPCEGYYNRGVIALSIAISPLWFAWYMLGHEINILSPETIGFFMIYWGIAISVGVLVLRFAPGGDGVMSIIIETPIAFYGFIMAATWIDYIADHLVSLLDFIGIILHIPGAVMGLTVLAWGNSMGDLSANMTMARKGLANMAMTACFAGPVFNILVGLGLGFTNLRNQTGNVETAVTLSAPILTGFVFVIINCMAIVATGVFVGKGRIEPWYGYIAVGLYIAYVVISIVLDFRGDN